MRKPQQILDIRKKATAVISEIKESVATYTEKWRNTPPPENRNTKIDFGLIEILIQTFKYAYSSLAADLSQGMEIVGHVSCTKVLAEKTVTATE